MVIESSSASFSSAVLPLSPTILWCATMAEAGHEVAPSDPKWVRVCEENKTKCYATATFHLLRPSPAIKCCLSEVRDWWDVFGSSIQLAFLDSHWRARNFWRTVYFCPATIDLKRYPTGVARLGVNNVKWMFHFGKQVCTCVQCWLASLTGHYMWCSLWSRHVCWSMLEPIAGRCYIGSIMSIIGFIVFSWRFIVFSYAFTVISQKNAFFDPWTSLAFLPPDLGETRVPDSEAGCRLLVRLFPQG